MVDYEDAIFSLKKVWPQRSIRSHKAILKLSCSAIYFSSAPNLLKTFQEVNIIKTQIISSNRVLPHRSYKITFMPKSCLFYDFFYFKTWSNYNLDLRSYGQLLSLFCICLYRLVSVSHTFYMYMNFAVWMKRDSTLMKQ